VGFKIADGIARSLDVELDNPQRLQAGLRFVLEEAESDGNTFLLLTAQPSSGSPGRYAPGAASAGPASPTTWSRTWPGATRRPRRQVGGRTLRGETGGSLPLPLQRRHGKVGLPRESASQAFVQEFVSLGTNRHGRGSG
jgi:hypothetical protein